MPGNYLFYLNQHSPHTIYLCYSAESDNKIFIHHKAIFRTSYGYCFTPSKISDPPTLIDFAAWLLLAKNPQSLEKNHFPFDLREKVDKIRCLWSLWSMQDVTICNEGYTKVVGAYATLQSFIQWNKLLVYPVQKSQIDE